MNTIKAIETHYKGYKFRSRLEARYAVFFDALGVKWEYEAEGFDLGQVGWYLPDFYFPQAQWHGEVKPDAPISKSDAAKMEYFDNHPPANSLGLLYLIGSPDVLPKNANWDSLTSAQRMTKHIAIRLNVYNHALIENAVLAFRQVRFQDNEGGSSDTNIDRAIKLMQHLAKTINGTWLINSEMAECVDVDVRTELYSANKMLSRLQAYAKEHGFEIHITPDNCVVGTFVAPNDCIQDNTDGKRHINITESLTSSVNGTWSRKDDQ